MGMFEELASDVIACRACPRLVSWREEVAITKRAAFQDWTYWGRPVPGFGDPRARIVVVGLAPAAHGANRTGRIFTGDRSGDFLFASLHRMGLANQPTATAVNDGLKLQNTYVTTAVRCAPPQNQPTSAERDACRLFLTREMELLAKARVFVALGAFGYGAIARELGIKPRPKFAHGLEVTAVQRCTVLCSYHVSQQNTFTGRLTAEMLDAVFARALEIASRDVPRKR
ncbi:MAG: uracil-DNA glycosylase [Acidimicrobiia bacterium]|nr:uracil-DNA glycosylase [Acidimicrobiia bacterium]MYC57148.1 uracil-DNA glycosylase [Acidimicrobiia bacterium]MYG93925.1 uracil-DNA glycosylase [Acidimicrobiia bacterium]MYI29928.1 uracil-DNA glycosylase [Acidimicrobiia bacterium]